MSDLMTEPTADSSSADRPGLAAKIAAALGVIAVLVAGIFVLGRIAATETIAMLLTAVWFGVVLVGGAAVAWRRRGLAVPLAVGYGLTAVAAVVLLGLPNLRDREVSEQVATAEVAAPVAGEDTAAEAAGDAAQADGSGDAADDTGAEDSVGSAGDDAGADEAGADTAAADTAGADTAGGDEAAGGSDGGDADGGGDAPARNVQLAAGTFVPLVHPGEGNAAVIDLADGGRVLTLTEFSTDNGPDLRVYLTTGDPTSGDIGEFVDIGALKGNRGDQQYDIPRNVNLERFRYAVVWCRAFSVGFTSAELMPAG